MFKNIGHRRAQQNNEVGAEASTVNHTLPSAIYDRPFGGIPLAYFYGDCCQLPPVDKKALCNSSTPSAVLTADQVGHLKFNKFLHPTDDTTVEGCSIVMDSVVYQSDT